MAGRGVTGEVINFGDVDTVLGRDLGEGTFGVVREIRHKTRDITVAVKIIRDNIREDERKSLVREVATIQQAGDCNTIVVRHAKCSPLITCNRSVKTGPN